MRNLHKYLKENYGLDALQLLWIWEKGVIRECDYKSHRIYTLRCIRKIIEKAEKKQLLQDRVRCFNKTMEAAVNTINNSRSRLASMVTNTTDLDRCNKFIDKVREDRYDKAKDRQVRKFNILISKSKNSHNNSSINNNNLMQVEDIARVDSNNSNSNSQSQRNDNNKWVINLSKTSLNEGQRSVLAKGPNISIASRHIPSVDYITAVVSMCPKLKEEDAMELRADINSLLRKAQSPKPNLTRQER